MYLPTTISRPLPDLRHLEKALSRLPSLMETLQACQTANLPEADQQLILREQILGSATLSGTALCLLYRIAAEQIASLQAVENLSDRYKRPLHQRLLLHRATQSATETQAVLPSGVLVQKTVSLDLAGNLILCSCVGTQSLGRSQLQSLADALSLPRRAIRHCTLNPVTCDPIQEFEMLSGMVSPFLRPQRPLRLAALALISWPERWEEQELEVAISLSLWESLLLPLRCLKAILLSYAGQAYPQLPLFQFDHEENTTLPPGDDAGMNAIQQGGVTTCHT